jgi:ribose 5-phosphate isomerase B
LRWIQQASKSTKPPNFLSIGFPTVKGANSHFCVDDTRSGNRELRDMRIHLANDHAGGDLRTTLMNWLTDQGIEIIDHGTPDGGSVDYPDHAHPLAQAVSEGDTLGILICGSANGVSMTANKHAGIRAAIAWRPDIAVLARQHNNANVLCLPARFIAIPDALDCVKAFLETPFEGGRHERRVTKIACS